jgi:aspartyl protease family protein
MRSVVVFAALAFVAALSAPRYFSHVGVTSAPTALEAHPTPPVAAAAATNSRSVVVPRSSRGHFEVDGRVNGRRLGFMVDTGASLIALTAHDAARLGIHPAQNAFIAEVKTANGMVRGAPVQLDSVEVGNLELHDVAALVLPDQALSDNLLGLSFLSRLHRFEYSDGRLVLEQ